MSPPVPRVNHLHRTQVITANNLLHAAVTDNGQQKGAAYYTQVKAQVLSNAQTAMLAAAVFFVPNSYQAHQLTFDCTDVLPCTPMCYTLQRSHLILSVPRHILTYVSGLQRTAAGAAMHSGVYTILAPALLCGHHSPSSCRNCSSCSLGPSRSGG